MNKLILTAILLAVYIVAVSAVSEPHCPDLDCPTPCPKIECPCGTYQPKCNCCSLCRTCSGQDCSLIPPTHCETGTCQLREGLSTAAALSSRGPHGKCP